jgi:hypothetical protein
MTVIESFEFLFVHVHEYAGRQNQQVETGASGRRAATIAVIPPDL